MKNFLEHCHFDIDKSEVYRVMGYPDRACVSEPVLHVCCEQITRVDDLAEPWGSYREVRIGGVGGDRVRLDSGKTLLSRRVASMLRRAASLQVCLVTLGSAVTAEIHRLMATNRMLEALALDAAATVATNGLMGQLRERICTEAGERNCGTTVPYGPGYTGWDIRDAPVLFSHFDGENVPVRLNQALMMIPEKSLLTVIGIVPGGPQALREVVPCRLCDLEHCSVRRVPYGEQSRLRGG